jgi:hypothetical protein
VAEPEHSSQIIAAAARRALAPVGFWRKGRSRVWLSDHGFWLTVVEFQPSGFGKGSYLNVAAHGFGASCRKRSVSITCSHAKNLGSRLRILCSLLLSPSNWRNRLWKKAANWRLRSATFVRWRTCLRRHMPTSQGKAAEEDGPHSMRRWRVEFAATCRRQRRCSILPMTPSENGVRPSRVCPVPFRKLLGEKRVSMRSYWRGSMERAACTDLVR